MAASVNNIAATFAALPVSSSSLASASSSSVSNQKAFTGSLSTSWNPHTTLRKPLQSSFLNLYGPPGPPPAPFRVMSSASPRPFSPPPLILVGRKIPSVTLSYLHREETVRTISASSLCKGNKTVFIGVSAAFSPSCTSFVRRVGSTMAKSWDLIACVGVNDVFVMKAWGEQLGLGRTMMMLSDGQGELSRALGVEVSAEKNTAANIRFGLQPRSFYFCAVDGVITTNITCDEDDLINYSKSTVIQESRRFL